MNIEELEKIFCMQPALEVDPKDVEEVEGAKIINRFRIEEISLEVNNNGKFTRA